MNEETTNTHIGEKIRSRRHELGMTQTDLGNKIGVTFQQIQKYEKGQNKITASKLRELANKMDVRIDYFYEGVDEKIDNKVNYINAVNEDPLPFSYEISDKTTSRETMALVKLFNNIEKKATRKKLLLFLKTLSKEEF